MSTVDINDLIIKYNELKYSGPSLDLNVVKEMIVNYLEAKTE